MNEFIRLLANGELAAITPYARQYSYYLTVSVLADGMHDLSNTIWSAKARALKHRADRKEPMNFELEAEKLFMDIIYAALNQ